MTWADLFFDMSIIDKEFGEIKIRKSKLARSVKISVGVDGLLRASIPYYSPEFAVKRLISHNRDEIRQMLSERAAKNLYRDGDSVGKTHTIIFRKIPAGEELKIKVEANQIFVLLPDGEDLDSPKVQAEIRKIISKILRKQARDYLSRRAEFLAGEYGFEFSKLRFSHTGTRWGSCSSAGVISLNIALMNLPLELIDYVIIHELCHLRQMNHSPAFWAEVAKYCPHYKSCVQEIKKYSPQI